MLDMLKGIWGSIKEPATFSEYVTQQLGRGLLTGGPMRADVLRLVPQWLARMARCERLRAENSLLRDQLNELRAKHQAVLAGQAEIVQSVGKFMTNMSQILEPMRELAEKVQHMPRGE